MEHVFAEIQEGKMKGRKMILTKEQLAKGETPAVVMVEDGEFLGGVPKFSPYCLVHERRVPDQGCPKCKEEGK